MRPRIDPVVIEDLGVRYEADVPLGPLTWYGVGGPADILAHPSSDREMGALASRCFEAGIPWYVLGSGANLLVAEEGVRGVVVKLNDDSFTRIQRFSQCVTVGAGADLAKLVIETGKMGLGGLEVLAGIPASVGGALRMNCGGKYGEIGPSVHSLSYMSDSGDIFTLKRDQVEFGYRSCSIKAGLFLSATFELSEDDPEVLRQRILDIFAYKKKTQPLASASAGCAFKNPPTEVSDKGAGQLIDEAGLKGLTVGGAQVSPVHANFITLASGGGANDVIRLIRLVKKRVQEHCGVMLAEEVVIWGNAPITPKIEEEKN